LEKNQFKFREIYEENLKRQGTKAQRGKGTKSKDNLNRGWSGLTDDRDERQLQSVKETE